MEFRRPTPDEQRLLGELAIRSGMELPEDWLRALLVRPMDDGGMGSLQLSTDAKDQQEARVVTCLASVQFTDEDGVEVIASLNAREDGVPFELDVWKTDFSTLRRIPNVFRSSRSD